MSRRKKWQEKQEALAAARNVAPLPPPKTLSEHVERARKAKESLQPRFKADSQKFFTSTMNWVVRAQTEEPPYSSKSRARDEWLQKFVQLEPHLAGVLSSVASIDSNRGWSLTGGRNQVKRFTRALHNFVVSGDVRGWRPGTRAASMQFHGCDLGAIKEIERDGERGPVTGFYSADPSHFELTGDINKPIQYFPKRGAGQAWEPGDYMRIVDIGFNAEELNGLGFCGVSRCLELAKVMVAVLLHDQEQLAARAPRGLLLVKGMAQEQWDTAMKNREAELTSKQRQYYGGVEVIASGMEDISATLLALSNLPADWNMETFTNLTLYGYALCMGYDAREFWPVSGGALGTATETEVQHRKATQKGAGDFSLADQEQMQREDVLPDTLEYLYDERDVGGELQEIEVNTAVAELANSLYASNLNGIPLLHPEPEVARQRAMQLLAEYNVIPQEWTVFEEDVTATDDEDVENLEADDLAEAGLLEGTPEERRRRDKLLSRERVFRACVAFGEEPLVKYEWPSARTRVLARRGADLLKRRTFPALSRQPILYEANKVLERAERLAEQLPSWASDRLTVSRSLLSPEDGNYLEADWTEEYDMPRMALTINPQLSPDEQLADMERQITAMRERGMQAIERRRTQQLQTEEEREQNKRRIELMERTVQLMQQIVEGLVAERERPVVVNVSTPPIVLPANPVPQVEVHPQITVMPAAVNLPAPKKRRVTLIEGPDGRNVAAEIE